MHRPNCQKWCLLDFLVRGAKHKFEGLQPQAPVAYVPARKGPGAELLVCTYYRAVLEYWSSRRQKKMHVGASLTCNRLRPSVQLPCTSVMMDFDVQNWSRIWNRKLLRWWSPSLGWTRHVANKHYRLRTLAARRRHRHCAMKMRKCCSAMYRWMRPVYRSWPKETRSSAVAMTADRTAYDVRYTGKLSNRFRLQVYERLVRTIRFN